MPCPNPACLNKDDRLIVKNGSVYRKTKDGAAPTPRGAKIMRYLCTKCGYTSRGSSFGLPETEEEENVSPRGASSPSDPEKEKSIDENDSRGDPIGP